MKLFIRGVWEGRGTQQQKQIDSTVNRVGEEKWIQVHADQEYVVKLELNRLHADQKVGEGYIVTISSVDFLDRFRGFSISFRGH